MPNGRWMGMLTVSRDGFKAIRSLIDQASDYLESENEEPI
jgi:hypothetical protein